MIFSGFFIVFDDFRFQWLARVSERCKGGIE